VQSAESDSERVVEPDFVNRTPDLPANIVKPRPDNELTESARGGQK
jgi:hypothetical protein